MNPSQSFYLRLAHHDKGMGFEGNESLFCLGTPKWLEGGVTCGGKRIRGFRGPRTLTRLEEEVREVEAIGFIRRCGASYGGGSGQQQYEYYMVIGEIFYSFTASTRLTGCVAGRMAG